MLTLPVSVHQQVWSKMLVSTVWFAATAVVVIAAFFVMSFEIGLMELIVKGLKLLLEELRFGEYVLDASAFAVELLILAFLACCSFCLEFYAALAIGHSVSGHKMVWSVAVFFGIRFVLGLLGGSIPALMDVTGLDYVLTQTLPRITSAPAAAHFMILTMGLMLFIQGAFFYFLTTYFLQKRLNLE